jgi:pimeloyl-ACP methyl ester carboxylesterase
MGAHTAALKFVAGSLRGRVRRPQDAGVSVPADLYAPDGPARSTVVYVHGMSLRGHRDVRQMAVCSSLTDAGCRVLAPALPRVADLRLELDTVDRVVTAIDQAAEWGDPVGLLAPSFSGALALRAAVERPETVRATCTIGCFGDPAQTIAWALENDHVDEYVRLVLFRNHVEVATGPRPAVVAALHALIEDDSLNRRVPLGPGVIADLSPHDRALLEQIRGDAATRARLARDIVPTLRPLTDALDVAAWAERVPGRVAVLHGDDDDVIPPSQAHRLHQVLRDAGVPTRVCVTPLLGHSEHAVGPGDALRLARLVRTLAFYFGGLVP